jgi:hypothetical protein
MSNLQIVYSHFTLEQWSRIVTALAKDIDIPHNERHAILVKCPSAALTDTALNPLSKNDELMVSMDT